MKSSSLKDKGRRLQQWCCRRISEVLEIPWGSDEEIASREMGQNGTDVRLSARVRTKLFPFSVEVKNQEKWSVQAWIEQAKKNRYPNSNWLLFISKNRYSPVVVMDAEVFFKMWKTIYRDLPKS